MVGDSKNILRWLTELVKFIYKKSDIIFVSNYGFKQSVIEKGISSNKVKFMPNWAEDIFETNKDIKVNRSEYNVPEGFVIMFAGNLGESQDFESIINAVELTKENHLIQWVFVGDGRKSKWIKEQVKVKGLTKTVTLLGRFPTVSMPYFFKLADIMLVSLKDEYIFSLTVPSKIQSYMASSKPIVTMLNGAGNDVVLGANCGFTALAGDYHKLAENVIKAANTSITILEEKGINGLRYYKENFSKKTIIDNFIQDL